MAHFIQWSKTGIENQFQVLCTRPRPVIQFYRNLLACWTKGNQKIRYSLCWLTCREHTIWHPLIWMTVHIMNMLEAGVQGIRIHFDWCLYCLFRTVNLYLHCIARKLYKKSNVIRKICRNSFREIIDL
jgi:hypothetical protein